MITVRKSEERGHANHGWLNTYHTFSFADYYDPRYAGFRHMLVLNEDHIQPDKGFPEHPHQNMEILTYIVSGALAHKDSTGAGSVVRRGNVQLMTAGTGVAHSEFNALKSEPVHLLQIWILPSKQNLKPSYRQKSFPEKELLNKLCLLASPDGTGGSLKINQQVQAYASMLGKGKSLDYNLKLSRHAWLQLVKGSVSVNNRLLRKGDGAAVSRELGLSFEAKENSEFLLFDMA